MDWARILAYVTGTVDQELLARNEYLAAENRIMKAQLKGRLRRAFGARGAILTTAAPRPAAGAEAQAHGHMGGVRSDQRALLAGTDFFTAEVLTLPGLVTYYVLFFIHLESRRVDIAGSTIHPDERWMSRSGTANFGFEGMRRRSTLS